MHVSNSDAVSRSAAETGSLLDLLLRPGGDRIAPLNLTSQHSRGSVIDSLGRQLDGGSSFAERLERVHGRLAARERPQSRGRPVAPDDQSAVDARERRGVRGSLDDDDSVSRSDRADEPHDDSETDRESKHPDNVSPVECWPASCAAALASECPSAAAATEDALTAGDGSAARMGAASAPPSGLATTSAAIVSADPAPMPSTASSLPADIPGADAEASAGIGPGAGRLPAGGTEPGAVGPDAATQSTSIAITAASGSHSTGNEAPIAEVAAAASRAPSPMPPDAEAEEAVDAEAAADRDGEARFAAALRPSHRPVAGVGPTANTTAAGASADRPLASPHDGAAHPAQAAPQVESTTVDMIPAERTVAGLVPGAAAVDLTSGSTRDGAASETGPSPLNRAIGAEGTARAAGIPGSTPLATPHSAASAYRAPPAVIGDPSRSPLEQIVEATLARAELQRGARDGSFELQLSPPELGALRVHLTPDEHGVVVRVAAVEPATQALLDAIRQELVAVLEQSHGLRLDLQLDHGGRSKADQHDDDLHDARLAAGVHRQRGASGSEPRSRTERVSFLA